MIAYRLYTVKLHIDDYSATHTLGFYASKDKAIKEAKKYLKERPDFIFIAIRKLMSDFTTLAGKQIVYPDRAIVVEEIYIED